MSTVDCKISSFRLKDSIQPIPFELFPEFCQCWMQDYYEHKSAVTSELRNVDAQKITLDQDATMKKELKVSGIKIRKQEKVKLSGAMRLYGRISEDCIKLDRGLKMVKERLDRMELEVKELEVEGGVLDKNAAKYGIPSAKKITQKVTELEQMEKELLNVVLDDELKDAVIS